MFKIKSFNIYDLSAEVKKSVNRTIYLRSGINTKQNDSKPDN
jgi:hypothetical protein